MKKLLTCLCLVSAITFLSCSSLKKGSLFHRPSKSVQLQSEVDKAAKEAKEDSQKGQQSIESKEAEASSLSQKGSYAKTSSVEIMWQVPTEGVMKYHIYYGYEANNLTNTATVLVTELEKVDSPVYGPLFRYIIKSVPTNQKLYFSLQSENKDGRSEMSAVQEVR